MISLAVQSITSVDSDGGSIWAAMRVILLPSIKSEWFFRGTIVSSPDPRGTNKVAFFNRIEAILVSFLVALQVRQDNVEQVECYRIVRLHKLYIYDFLTTYSVMILTSFQVRGCCIMVG